MKKKALITAVSMFTMAAMTTSASAIDVYLDNEKVEFEKEPYLSNERTLVPIRPIFEQMGWDVEWNNNKVIISHSETISNDFGVEGEYSKKIELEVGTNLSNAVKLTENNLYEIFSQYYVTDIEPIINDGVCMVPVRAIAEIIGKNVTWDSSNQCVYIKDGEPDYTYYVIGANTIDDDGNEIYNSGEHGVEGLRKACNAQRDEELIALIPLTDTITGEKGVQARFAAKDGGYKTVDMFDGGFKSIGYFPE